MCYDVTVTVRRVQCAANKCAKDEPSGRCYYITSNIKSTGGCAILSWFTCRNDFWQRIRSERSGFRLQFWSLEHSWVKKTLDEQGRFHNVLWAWPDPIQTAAKRLGCLLSRRSEVRVLQASGVSLEHSLPPGPLSLSYQFYINRSFMSVTIGCLYLFHGL